VQVICSKSRDQAALSAAQEATRGELVEFHYAVTHELRQPLNVVYAYVQAILLCNEELDADCRGADPGDR